jgi:enamine deaminase RidA (YjgF/YER057c/UK114 family)
MQNFQRKSPARSTIQVAALPKGGLVEIEAIAVI